MGSGLAGAAEMWMEAANAWSDGDVGDLLLRAALFSAAHTEQASLIQVDPLDTPPGGSLSSPIH